MLKLANIARSLSASPFTVDFPPSGLPPVSLPFTAYGSDDLRRVHLPRADEWLHPMDDANDLDITTSSRERGLSSLVDLRALPDAIDAAEDAFGPYTESETESVGFLSDEEAFVPRGPSRASRSFANYWLAVGAATTRPAPTTPEQVGNCVCAATAAPESLQPRVPQVTAHEEPFDNLLDTDFDECDPNAPTVEWLRASAAPPTTSGSVADDSATMSPSGPATAHGPASPLVVASSLCLPPVTQAAAAAAAAALAWRVGLRPRLRAQVRVAIAPPAVAGTIDTAGPHAASGEHSSVPLLSDPPPKARRVVAAPSVGVRGGERIRAAWCPPGAVAAALALQQPPAAPGLALRKRSTARGVRVRAGLVAVPAAAAAVGVPLARPAPSRETLRLAAEYGIGIPFASADPSAKAAATAAPRWGAFATAAEAPLCPPWYCLQAVSRAAAAYARGGELESGTAGRHAGPAPDLVGSGGGHGGAAGGADADGRPVPAPSHASGWAWSPTLLAALAAAVQRQTPVHPGPQWAAQNELAEPRGGGEGSAAAGGSVASPLGPLGGRTSRFSGSGPQTLNDGRPGAPLARRIDWGAVAGDMAASSPPGVHVPTGEQCYFRWLRDATRRAPPSRLQSDRVAARVALVTGMVGARASDGPHRWTVAFDVRLLRAVMVYSSVFALNAAATSPSGVAQGARGRGVGYAAQLPLSEAVPWNAVGAHVGISARAAQERYAWWLRAFSS